MTRIVKWSQIAAALAALAAFSGNALAAGNGGQRTGNSSQGAASHFAARGGGGGGGGGHASGGGGGGGSRSSGGGGGGGGSRSSGGGNRSFSGPSANSGAHMDGRSFADGARNSSSHNFSDGRTLNSGHSFDHNFASNSGHGQEGNHGGNWNHGDNWNHGGNWNHGDWGGHGNWWWGISPLLGYYGGWGNGYGYGYNTYNNYYGYGSYPYSGYSYDNVQPAYYANNQTATAQTATYPPQSAMQENRSDYMTHAISAFQNGNYSDAMRLASHAAIDSPRDPEAHLVISLSAMANKDFRFAAAEAHAVVALGNVPKWDQVYEVYNDLDRYTSQLRTLEAAARTNAKDPGAHFMLGFLYLAMGYRTDAQTHLDVAVQEMPNDKIAQSLLSDAGGQVPATASPESRDGAGDGRGSSNGPSTEPLLPPLPKPLSGTSGPPPGEPPAAPLNR